MAPCSAPAATRSPGSRWVAAYPTFRTLAQRISDRCAALPDAMDAEARASAVARITEIETARRTRVAVAGFDLTFTAPKSASVLWALADPKTQAAVVAAHRAAVDEALAFVEDRALFTRVGQRSCAQVPTRGMIAAAFDHWDTRTGDPNLHTHVVIANKVQGPDGGWRSVDSRALHHAVVAVSEVYDNLLADDLARDLPVSWSWRPRGPRRTPAFEVDGVGDDLLTEFSTRSAGIDAAMTDAVVDFHATHGRGPNRVEILQLRQRVTRATRPEKTAHPLVELLRSWRDRAARLTGRTPAQLTDAALGGSRRGRAARRGLRAGDLSEQVVARLAGETLDAVMTRRSTWTRWNLLAETARTTRGLRLATPAERHALHDRVIDAALATCVALDPGEVFTVPAGYRRPDGTSVFARPGEDAFTHQRILDAEHRLLHATTDLDAPTASEATARRIATTPQPARDPGGAPVRLADDQVDAVISIATSGRRLEVLVGPAGTGKTTTLRALRTAWEATYGHGSVIGLAPSATAAHELADALRIGVREHRQVAPRNHRPRRPDPRRDPRRAQRTPRTRGRRRRPGRAAHHGRGHPRPRTRASPLVAATRAAPHRRRGLTGRHVHPRHPHRPGHRRRREGPARRGPPPALRRRRRRRVRAARRTRRRPRAAVPVAVPAPLGSRRHPAPAPRAPQRRGHLRHPRPDPRRRGRHHARGRLPRLAAPHPDRTVRDPARHRRRTPSTPSTPAPTTTASPPATSHPRASPRPTASPSPSATPCSPGATTGTCTSPAAGTSATAPAGPSPPPTPTAP